MKYITFVLTCSVVIVLFLFSLVNTLINRDSKDFGVMLFHHLITPAEIWFSYQCNYAAIGLVIMYLHDSSDVFLHLAKAFHNEAFKKCTDITFVLFAFIFFVTRLLLLPMCPYAYFFQQSHQDTCGHILATTCSVLVCLHMYWFSLIVKMILRFAEEGEHEGDIREVAAEQERTQSTKKTFTTTVTNSQKKKSRKEE